ncbi:transmembrane protein 91 [Platysternon megacephalum]|uniref:Transmembrane protein 91 n=1 Tax=Platysternon megacephalum TaxID=55544 RepID=A0A4D9DXD4_9SAUR|nr:transmembrane protein 91 [Platysternon megacephalum]
MSPVESVGASSLGPLKTSLAQSGPGGGGTMAGQDRSDPMAFSLLPQGFRSQASLPLPTHHAYDLHPGSSPWQPRRRRVCEEGSSAVSGAGAGVSGFINPPPRVTQGGPRTGQNLPEEVLTPGRNESPVN